MNDAHDPDGHIGVTTIESNRMRPLVEPYLEKPTVEQAAGAVACKFCGNAQFRRSHVRFADLLEMLMLRFPLRCMRCGQRQFNMLWVAMLSFPPKNAGERQTSQAPGSSWKSWTDASTKGQLVARPLSTALGPRAERLESAAPPPLRPAPPARVPSRREDNDIW